MYIQIFSIFEAFQETRWQQIRKFQKENEKDIFLAISSQADVIRNSIVRSSIEGSFKKPGRNIDLVLKELDSKIQRISQLEAEVGTKQQMILSQESVIRDLRKNLHEKTEELKQSQKEKKEALRHFEESFLDRKSGVNLSQTSLRDLR